MKVKKSKHRHEQNVHMSRHDENEKPKDDTPTKHNATSLKVQITEDGKGGLDVEWVAVFKGTDVAVPMRYSHVIGKLEAAKFILLKTFYSMDAPEVSQTPSSK